LADITQLATFARTGAALVTGNVRELGRVEDLRVEDWS
jgi:predicted nucleic acid-binding protein